MTARARLRFRRARRLLRTAIHWGTVPVFGAAALAILITL